MVHRDGGFSAKFTLTRVKIHLVSENRSPSKSAIGAQNRRRDAHFFVETQIVRRDFKLGFAVFTGFCFSIHHLNLRQYDASYYLGLITLFTINNLRPLGSVGGLKFVGAMIIAVEMLGGILIDAIF